LIVNKVSENIRKNPIHIPRYIGIAPYGLPFILKRYKGKEVPLLVFNVCTQKPYNYVKGLVDNTDKRAAHIVAG